MWEPIDTLEEAQYIIQQERPFYVTQLHLEARESLP